MIPLGRRSLSDDNTEPEAGSRGGRRPRSSPRGRRPTAAPSRGRGTRRSSTSSGSAGSRWPRRCWPTAGTCASTSPPSTTASTHRPVTSRPAWRPSGSRWSPRSCPTPAGRADAGQGPGPGRRPDDRLALRHLPRHRLPRARGLRPDGDHLRRPPRPVQDPHARGLGGPPPPQGLRRRRHPRAVQGAVRQRPIDRRGGERRPGPTGRARPTARPDRRTTPAERPRLRDEDDHHRIRRRRGRGTTPTPPRRPRSASSICCPGGAPCCGCRRSRRPSWPTASRSRARTTRPC